MDGSSKEVVRMPEIGDEKIKHRQKSLVFTNHGFIAAVIGILNPCMRISTAYKFYDKRFIEIQMSLSDYPITQRIVFNRSLLRPYIRCLYILTFTTYCKPVIFSLKRNTFSHF
jgi:hypothetical protein